jgi:hypothetical protein
LCVQAAQKKMDEYNRRRRMAGLPVEYELGLSIAEYNEKRGKQIAERTRSLLVHVACISPDGQCVGYLNGLFYLGGGQEPLVLTCAHVLGWGGAATYEAHFCDEAGSTYDGLPLQLLKAGAVVPGQQPAAPQVHEYRPDLAVFKVVLPAGKAMPMLAPPLPPALPNLGDKTYILAYVGGPSHGHSFTDGMVSSSGLDVFETTAYADHGYSGAPVISTRGLLLGLVVRGVGVSMKQVAFIPVNAIEMFLVSGAPQVPGLPVI